MGREKPGAPTLPQPTAGTLPHSMFGVWKVAIIGGFKEKWEFKEDGTCAITPGTGQIPTKFCTWSKKKDQLEVRYPNGDITSLQWSIKNDKLQGSSKGGGHVWLEKGK